MSMPFCFSGEGVEQRGLLLGGVVRHRVGDDERVRTFLVGRPFSIFVISIGDRRVVDRVLAVRVAPAGVRRSGQGRAGSRRRRLRRAPVIGFGA